MPVVRGWEVYHKWCKDLGEYLDSGSSYFRTVVAHLHSNYLGTSLLYLNAAGTNIIVLDTYEDCIALLEKRSAIYSGRSVDVGPPDS